MGRKLKGRQGKPYVAKGLQGALQNHIAKESHRQDRVKAAELAKEHQANKQRSMLSGHHRTKKAKQNHPKKAFIPFKADETILLVGEGDFSFACSLVRCDYVQPENLVALSYDSHEELVAKYPGVEENLAFLQESGVRVVHDVDATDLGATLKIKKMPLFSLPRRLHHVMFNFPHTGRGMKDMDRNVRDHQKLVLGYFKSAKELLAVVNRDSNNTALSLYLETGAAQPAQKIILSVFEGEPYVSWGIKALARSLDLRVERSGEFDWLAFEGYHHRRTNSTQDTTKPAAERLARMYVFDKFQKTEPKKVAAADSDSE